MNKLFAVVCAAALAGFVALERRGVDLFPDSRRVAGPPSSVRGAPGAYRSYRSWGGGFHGGK